MPKKISTLNPGNLVKLNEAGTPIQFIFLEYNHYGKNEVTLLQKELYDRHRNNWAAHDNTALYYTFLDYYCMGQYVNLLDPMIRACLIPIDMNSRLYALNNITPVSVLASYKRSCFVLSSKEYGAKESSYVFSDEGSTFSYFTSYSNRIAYPRSEYYERDIKDGVSADYYVTRTMGNWATPDRTRLVCITELGRFDYLSVDEENFTYPTFTRIAITLSSDIMVSDTTDSDDCYNIVRVPAAENYQKVNGVWMKMV